MASVSPPSIAALCCGAAPRGMRHAMSRKLAPQVPVVVLQLLFTSQIQALVHDVQDLLMVSCMCFDVIHEAVKRKGKDIVAEKAHTAAAGSPAAQQEAACFHQIWHPPAR